MGRPIIEWLPSGATDPGVAGQKANTAPTNWSEGANVRAGSLEVKGFGAIEQPSVDVPLKNYMQFEVTDAGSAGKITCSDVFNGLTYSASSDWSLHIFVRCDNALVVVDTVTIRATVQGDEQTQSVRMEGADCRIQGSEQVQQQCQLRHRGRGRFVLRVHHQGRRDRGWSLHRLQPGSTPRAR